MYKSVSMVAEWLALSLVYQEKLFFLVVGVLDRYNAAALVLGFINLMNLPLFLHMRKHLSFCSTLLTISEIYLGHRLVNGGKQ